MMSKSKQAVNDVLNRRQPEYIPLGTYAIDCDTAARIIGHETYVRNKIKIQVALWEGRRDEVVQSLKEDSVELFRKLDCIDVIVPMKEAPILPPKNYSPPRVKKIDDTTWELDDGSVYRCSYLTNDISIVKHPSKEYVLEDFIKKAEESIPDDSIFEAYDHLVEHMKNERFLAGASGGFEPMVLLGGMEEGFVKYFEEPDLVKAAIEYEVRKANFLDKYYIRNGIDQVFVEGDFASTSGPFMSPAMFREFCFPAIEERVKNIKKYRDKVMLHSCGNTWSLIDMFIEGGIDCLQSLQTGAGMDIKKLKEKYGSRMSFWGGVGVENLVDGTPDDVRKDVRYAMKHGSPNGGFILGPSHSIAYGTKYDNFMAMLDEYDKLKYQCSC